MFQTGLALGNLSGNCEVCNIDLSWLYSSPSKLLWLDKIVVTDYLWKLLDNPNLAKYGEINDGDNLRSITYDKSNKLVFDILDSVGLIERISDDFVSDTKCFAINQSLDQDFDLLQKDGIMQSEDSHIYRMGNNIYCKPRLWTLYFSLLASRKLDANISLSAEEMDYLKAILPYRLEMSKSISNSTSAINDILEMKIPQVNIWPDFILSDKKKCLDCAKFDKCNDSYLKDIEKNLFTLLEYRQHDEIQEFCNVLNRICDKKFKDRFEIDSEDLLHELNLERVRVQAKLNKTYKKVEKWTKVVGTLSAALSLGAIFGYPEITPIGAIGLFASNTGETLNQYLKEKYRWVNFIS